MHKVDIMDSSYPKVDTIYFIFHISGYNIYFTPKHMDLIQAHTLNQDEYF